MTIHHQSSVTPAEAWRRWLAAAIDAFLLFVAHTFLWLVNVVALPTWDGMDTFLEVFGAVIGLTYLVLCWRLRGATLGQEAVGIKVVRYDGAPLTWGDTLRRLLGYILAALPLHIGFLSLFWDDYRRGWHDRIARTLVVRRQPTEPLLPLPPPAAQPPPFVEDPAPPMAWHRGLLAALIYIGIALGFTYPTLTHFSTHRAGVGGDAGFFMWGFWHAHEAILQGRQSLLTTDALFFPVRTHLLYHTVCWVYAVPAAFVLQWLSLTETYNLFFLLSLSAAAFTAFGLARALHCEWMEALLAGILFSFSPYIMAHGKEGHLNLVAAEFIALFALMCYGALMRPSLWRALGAGIALSLVGYGDWYYAVFALFLSVCLAMGITLQRTSWRPCASLLLIWIVASLCLSPLLVPTLRERSHSHYMDAPLSLAQTYSTDLAYAWFSNPLHPLWGEWVARHLHPGPEQVGGLSLVAMVLGIVAMRKRWRQMLPWTLTGVLFLILACGPTLRIAGREVALPSWLVLVGGGPPGNGFSSPLSANLSMSFARDAVNQPASLWSSKTSLPMPFTWLRQLCPPIRPLRAPGRFIVVTSLCVAVLAACGLRFVRHAVRQRWGNQGERFVVILIGLLVLLEYLPFPYPITSTEVSRFYHQLAKEPGTSAVVEVPVGYVTDTYSLYQTVHGKPLFSSYLSRTPPEAVAFRDRNRLLKSLKASGDYDVRSLLTLEEIGVGTQSLSELRQQFEPSLRELAAIGGKYIILHKAMLKASALKQADRLLREALLLPIRWDDSELRVYQIQEVTTDKQ